MQFFKYTAQCQRVAHLSLFVLAMNIGLVVQARANTCSQLFASETAKYSEARLDIVNDVFNHPKALNQGYWAGGVTPDSRYAVFAANGTTPDRGRISKGVAVVDLKTLGVRQLVRDGGSYVAAELLPGSWLAHVTSSPNEIPFHQVFDLRSGQEIWSRYAMINTKFKISSDQKQMIGFDMDSRNLTIWNLADRKVVATRHLEFLSEQGAKVIDILSTNSRIVLRSHESVVSIDQKTLEPVFHLKRDEMDGLASGYNSSDFGHLNYSAEKGTIKIRSFLSGRTLQSFPIAKMRAFSDRVVFDPKNEHVYMWRDVGETIEADRRNHIDVVNLRTKNLVATIKSDDRISGVVSGGPLLGVLKADGRLEWYDRRNGRLVQTMYVPKSENQEFNVFDMTPDGHHAIARDSLRNAPYILSLKTAVPESLR